MQIHESKMTLTAKIIPNSCCVSWNKPVLTCSLAKFGSSCPLGLLYSVVVGRRGCVWILGRGVIDRLISHAN